MTLQARTTSFHRWNPAPSRFLEKAGRADAQNIQRRSGLDIQARVPGFVRTVELLIVVGLGLAAHRFGPGRNGPITAVDWLEIVLAAIIFVNYSDLGHAYRFRALKSGTAQLTGVSLAWACTIGSLLPISWIGAINGGLIRPWAITWFLAAWLAVLGWRATIRLWIDHHHRRGDWRIRVAIAGDGTPAFDLARRLEAVAGNVDIVGVFVAGSCPLQGKRTIDDLYNLVNSEGIDEILIALPWPSPVELNAAIRKLCVLPVDVKLYAGAPGPGLDRSGIESDDLLPTLPIQRRPLLGWGAPLKRAEDIILASILVCTLAPLLLLIAALIKLDSRGPVFFLQERFGFNNNSVRVYKFRTMYHDPDPDPVVPQARRNDPRVTRIGAFLRRTSLDELPQLFNVLGGSMSLIGPRPHATIHNKKYGRLIDGYLGRHRMKPGITGWAQVNGHRGETDTVEKMRLRLQHDLYYIDNWSLLLDLKVLVTTVPAVVWARNAY